MFMAGLYKTYKSERRSKEQARQFKTCVYFSNWSVYDKKHFAIDIPVEHITHLFYAFLAIDTDTGKLKLSDEWCDLQMPVQSASSPFNTVTGNLQQIYEMKKKNRNLKVLMSVGGWGSDQAFETVMSSVEKMKNFVDSAAETIQEYGFDGIDIDWEYPRGKKQCGQLVECLKLLKERLKVLSDDLLVTIASPSGQDVLDTWNLKDIDKYLSFWNVMCYDFSGQGWSSTTGYHSNLYGSNGSNYLSADAVVNYYIQRGVRPDKLVLGMPLYGRAFKGVHNKGIGSKFDKPRSTSGADSDTIDFNRLPLPGFTEHFDDSKISAFCNDSNSKTFVAYDNERSAKIKAQYVASKGLAGGMWWDSSGDSKDDGRSIIKSFVAQLGGLEKLKYESNHINLYHDSKYLAPLKD